MYKEVYRLLKATYNFNKHKTIFSLVEEMSCNKALPKNQITKLTLSILHKKKQNQFTLSILK